MGWSRGAELAEEVYGLVRSFIPEDKRKDISRQFYDLFCELDADTWDNECQIAIDCGLIEEWNEDE